MNNAASFAINLTEQGHLPDVVIRAGIRRLVRQRLQSLCLDDAEISGVLTESFIHEMTRAPIALIPDKANEQHYEVPATFYAHVLGPHRKYSGAYWPEDTVTLDDAEAAALAKTCEHADLQDGQDILELGCGWGSLSLWMARCYPRARILAVSNSHSQRAFIERCARERGFTNLRVLTCDMNAFDTEQRFDRVVSVEMFEHMRNWRELFARIHRWLYPDGRFFMHIFCHRSVPYVFTEQDETDWMGRYFFSGGMMPSDELPLRFQEHMKLVERWRWDGRHYERTANAWLTNLDQSRDRVWAVLEQSYGQGEADIWLQRWRLFFMACAELFGYDNGQQWWVSHYLFEKPVAS
jgi:cyclopropane-fatty-acyl-phospholipid synthase